MFNFITSIFKRIFWFIVIALIIVIELIVMGFDGCTRSCSRESFEDSVERSIKKGKTEEAAVLLHEHFINECNADTNDVSAKDGYLAEKAIDKCLAVGDVESAKMIYRDYKYGISDFKRPILFEYLKKHNSPDSSLYTPVRYGWLYSKTE